MLRSYFKVKRGMVFSFEPPVIYGDTSVQQGRRPWVVVSNDKANLASTTCNIAPCTTANKTPIPTHVVTMFNNQRNTIMVEQNIPVDQFNLKNSEYMGMLTDETLIEIEKAVAIHYDVRPDVLSDKNAEFILGYFESVIEKIVVSRIPKKHEPIPEDVIVESAKKIGKLLEETLIPELPKSSDTIHTSQNNDTHNNDEQSFQKGKRIKWTVELRQQYLKDMDTMTPEQVQTKYGFGNIKTVFQTKYICKNSLAEAERNLRE